MHLVCIVGAGRSGTNLLEQTLCRENAAIRILGENRYVWNYGQRDLSCDNREASEATAAVATYIRRHFAARCPADNTIIVDKTPSNALRLKFVSEVFPQVKIINVIRDARDNMVSRWRQWNLGVTRGPPERSHVPVTYGRTGLIRARVRHAFSLWNDESLPAGRWPTMIRDAIPSLLEQVVTGRPKRYGERVAGLMHIRDRLGVDVAAAVQWRDVVMTAHVDGRQLGADRYYEFKFEELVDDPECILAAVVGFLGLQPTGLGASYIRSTLLPAEEPVWLRPGPAREQILKLEAYLRPTLEYFGYGWR